MNRGVEEITGMFKYGDWEVRLDARSHPRVLMVELSTNCNYKCLHCFRNAVKNFSPCNMSIELFERIVEEARGAGVNRIVFSGWGEPTSNPHFMEMLRESKQMGFQVALNTNGSTLEHDAEALVEIGLDELFLSIDAYDLQLYGFMRRPGDLTSLSNGLKRLFKTKISRNSFKPEVTAIFTITRLNISEITKALDFARSNGLKEVRFSNYIDFGTGESELECLSDEDCISEVRRELSKVSHKVFETGVKVIQPNLALSTSRFCPFVSNRALFIKCDGSVAPCLYYARSWSTRVLGISRKIREVVLGDIRKESLIDIWRKKYAKMFMRLYFLRLPSCLDCDLAQYCLITRSNDFDCWGNRPSCAHCPYLHGFSHCPL